VNELNPPHRRVHAAPTTKSLKKKGLSKKQKKLNDKARQKAEDFLSQLETKQAKKLEHTVRV